MAWLYDDVLLTMPPPTYLVEDLLVDGSLAALVSAPGVGKTFVALDLAYSIATGQSWHGFHTRQGAVVYILAEGKGGIGQRVRAWRHDRKIPDHVRSSVFFWDNPVQIASVLDRSAFLMHLKDVPEQPVLIIVDTLARCFIGKDENAAQDMGQFIEGLDILRSSGAAVLVLHHQGHKPGRERGSTALRGAVDELLFLDRGSVSGEIVLTTKKQKEGELIDPVYLRMRQYELPDESTSVVLDDAPWSEGTGAKLPDRWLEAVRLLAKMPSGATTADWQKLAKLPKATYHRMRRVLVDRGIVVQDGDRYIARRKPPEPEQPKDERDDNDAE